MSDIDFDLDALAPRPGKVKHKGKSIDIAAPKLKDLFEGASIIDKLDAAQEVPDIEAEYENLTVFFKRVIPEIEDQLSIYQYKKLYEKLQELAIPPESKALEEAGISIVSDGEQKKEEPDTLEK